MKSGMKYLFDMGEVWHVYSDVGSQWIYHRLEQKNEEILDKNGENLPGPLGKLDILKQLEAECSRLKEQAERLQKENCQMQDTLKQEKEKAEQIKIRAEEKLYQEKKRSAEQTESLFAEQKEKFEKSYAELKNMAEELQKEGRMWRQRYLDLAYQVRPKEK